MTNLVTLMHSPSQSAKAAANAFPFGAHAISRILGPVSDNPQHGPPQVDGGRAFGLQAVQVSDCGDDEYQRLSSSCKEQRGCMIAGTL